MHGTNKKSACFVSVILHTHRAMMDAVGDAHPRVDVTIFDGGTRLFTSMHSFIPGEHTYADLINSVAFRNANIVIIDPNNVLLEYVRDDSFVVAMVPSALIDAAYSTFEMQIGLSRRMLVRATILKDKTHMLSKIASIMHLSLTKTDNLVYLAAGHKVGPSFVIYQFYAEFATRQLHATIKTYFENYFSVVSITRSCARDAHCTLSLFMSMQFETNLDDGSDDVVALEGNNNRAYCGAVQKRLYAEKPTMYGTVHLSPHRT